MPLAELVAPGHRLLEATLDLTVERHGSVLPWELQIQQQVDVPLVEPPLAEMTAAGAAPLAAVPPDWRSRRVVGSGW